MRAWKKDPGKKWREVEVENTLESLQAEVQGRIEPVYLTDELCLICNEEGALRHMPYNCTIKRVDFLGQLLIVSVEGEDFAGVDEEQDRALRAMKILPSV